MREKEFCEKWSQRRMGLDKEEYQEYLLDLDFLLDGVRDEYTGDPVADYSIEGIRKIINITLAVPPQKIEKNEDPL